MRLVLKVLVVLIAVLIKALIWICVMVLAALAYVSGVAGSALTLLAAFVFCFGEQQQAMVLLVGAWLVSPLGLPQAVVWLLGRLQDICDVMMDAAV